MIYWTSDLHISHPRVAEIRGFDSVDEHDDWIASLFDQTGPGDQIYVLGDVIGRDRDWDRALNLLWGLPGGSQVHLVAGNHDPCHPCRPQSIHWGAQYLTAFDSVAPYRVRRLEGRRLHMSHFPYNIPDGHADRNPDDVRWPEWRLQDLGHPLVHGHLHTEVKEHGNQFHVGVDAHQALVPESTIAAWLRSLNVPEAIAA